MTELPGKLDMAPGPSLTQRRSRRSPYLYSNHRQDLHRDPVKLVKATPGSRLCQALVDISTGLQRESRIREREWPPKPPGSRRLETAPLHT